MNQRVFVRNLRRVTISYVCAVLIGLTLKVCPSVHGVSIYDAFRDSIPLIIATPAAWLGYCFQRRQAYLRDVRELWLRMVAAVQGAIQYTHMVTPDQVAFGKALCDLSTAIEELRGVFANVGEESGRVGLYPFESLKHIHQQISALSFGDQFKMQDAARARRDIVELWKKLRRSFLAELERGAPGADSPYLED